MIEKNDIEGIKDIAKLAGEKIMEIYSGNFSHSLKNDESPLTEADLESNGIILKGLSETFPGIPVLSEEKRVLPYEQRKNWNECFLVDPLDGTKEFINRNGEFTVNIAYVKNGIPAAGVVYAPALDILYFSVSKESFAETKKGIRKINVAPIPARPRVVASKSHFNKETKEYIEKITEEYELINIGSSLKICLVAEGKADIYPRIAPTMEWDTAAAHTVLKNAGGELYDYKSGVPLVYNKKELKNPGFVAKSI